MPCLKMRRERSSNVSCEQATNHGEVYVRDVIDCRRATGMEPVIDAVNPADDQYGQSRTGSLPDTGTS